MATDEDVKTAPAELPVRTKPEDAGIVETYKRLLAEDPDLTMPIAAIEALIEILGRSQVTTVHETINLIKTESEKLHAGVENSFALSHGTYLLQQYITNSLKQPSGHENFDVVRQHLLRNGRLFVTRAKNARDCIAVYARRQIRHGETIMTYGGSRVVGALLSKAARKHDYGTYVDRPRRFSVVYVVESEQEAENDPILKAIEAENIPVAIIPIAAVSHAMEQVDMVVVGAEAVTANGGIISRLGTYQIAEIAMARNKPFYVAAEQHKFGITFPTTQRDFGLPFKQHIVDFKRRKAQREGKPFNAPIARRVDYTPPEHIKLFFSDHKVLSPDVVAKEVIDMM